MPVSTPDTFDALKRYVSVRLQQGVPLVDADWNAVDDTRRFELRAFLRWYVGNGIPDGSDGFEIQSVGAVDDFKIACGITGTVDALANVGRCLVDGLDVMITADVNFKAQPLHTSQGGAAALATAWGVTVVQPPPSTGNVSVYLDVWERRVTASEDPSLLVAGVGVESCARLKREWVVRARAGTSAPQQGDADFAAGHSYYELARFTRTSATAITAAMLVDRREQRLLLPPATLSIDLFDTDPHDYRRGLGRPALPLREAINSLLRGEIPSSDATQIAASTSIDVAARAYVFDRSGGIVVVWRSDRNGAVNQIWQARIDTTVQPYAATGTAAISSGTSHQEPAAALLPNGDLVVAYVSGIGTATDVVFKRGAPAALAAATETQVASTAGLQEDLPLVLVSGTNVLFFYRSRPASTNVWNVRRYDLGTNAFPGAATAVYSGVTLGAAQAHAALDAAGNAWIAAYATSGTSKMVSVAQVSALGVTVYQSATELTSTTIAPDASPFVLPLSSGDVRVFWRAGNIATPNAADGLWCGIRHGGVWTLEQIPDTDASDGVPAAVEDADGGIWLFWVRTTTGVSSVRFRYRDPAVAAWGEVRELISANTNDIPTPFVDAAGGVWVFWNSDASGDYDLWFKRLVPAI